MLILKTILPCNSAKSILFLSTIFATKISRFHLFVIFFENYAETILNKKGQNISPTFMSYFLKEMDRLLGTQCIMVSMS